MTNLSPDSSNIAKSRVLVERLRRLLRDVEVADVPFRKRRIYRPWVAQKIGCSRSTLTINPRLRKTLISWEKENAPEISTVVRTTEDDDDRSNVIDLGRAARSLPDGIIRPITIVVNGGSYTVPALYWDRGLDEWVCSYLRYVVVKKKNDYSSAAQDAEMLRIFRRFQRLNSVDTADITDDFLMAWQNSMTANGLKISRRNSCISTVHAFLKWAETTGRLRNHVQLAPYHEYSADLGHEYVFPVSSKQVTIRRHGSTYLTWVSTLIEPGARSNFGSRHTPTHEEIGRLVQEVLDHGRNAVRNNLIISWALQTGGRVSEILQVKVSDLPSQEALGDVLDGDEINIKLKRKNRGESVLRVPVQLVSMTLEYAWFDEERCSIAEKHGQSDFVFLSEKGGVLNADSVTRICGAFFVKAQIKNANIHRLRARFITDVIEQCLDDMEAKGQRIDLSSDWSMSILTMAKNMMGHSHVVSLVPYLNEIRVRRIQIDGTILPRAGAKQETGTNIYSADVREAERLFASGMTRAAAEMLRRAADRIDAPPAAVI